jgi:HK97 family phage major capsid protein
MTKGVDGPLVPTQFEKQLILTALAAGPLVAGSPACSEVQTPTGGARKMPISDDLANIGFVQVEGSSSPYSEGELTLGQVSMGATTFSSGIAVLSNELLQDAEWVVTGEKVLQSTLGKRLGRIQNSTFLPALITALGSNPSASVAAGASTLAYSDLTNLVGAVNAQYRYSEKAGFLMNSSTQKAIANLKDSQLRPIFADVMASRPTLMDYPVFVSDYADSISSTKNPILFGDFSYVFIRHIPGITLQVMTQRFIENYQTGFIARKRADLQYAVPTTADSAIKMLHFA